MAHEWGHLAGFADEGDANFVGWLTCLRGSVANQYSGWLFLYGELSRVLRGPECKIPPTTRDDETFEVTAERLEAWAGAGWVDLREANMARWRDRFTRIKDEMDSIPERDTSSRFLRDRQFWGAEEKIQPGKVVGWIFGVEDKGARMK